MDFETDARTTNRCGPFLGDTSETARDVLHSELPSASD
jgi:hypothetical protein